MVDLWISRGVTKCWMKLCVHLTNAACSNSQQIGQSAAIFSTNLNRRRYKVEIKFHKNCAKNMYTETWSRTQNRLMGHLRMIGEVSVLEKLLSRMFCFFCFSLCNTLVFQYMYNSIWSEISLSLCSLSFLIVVTESSIKYKLYISNIGFNIIRPCYLDLHRQ